MTVTGRYRRRPGAWLIAAALLIPLFLALVGTWMNGGTPARNEAAGQAAAPAPQVATVGDPIRVETADGKRTVTARVRDAASRDALLNGVRAASQGMRVADDITVDDAADAPAVAGVGTILAAGQGIPDLGLVVDRGSITLTGTAQDQAAATSTVFAAGQSYPGVRLVDQLRLPGAPAVAAAPLTPECEQVRNEVAADLKANPVQFALSGATVADASQQHLKDIAAKLGRCQFNAIEVAGHTDSTGSAAVNQSLSQRRAESVRQVLIAGGVSEQIITAKGYGSTKPISDNATPQGQATNRRVEINAS